MRVFFDFRCCTIHVLYLHIARLAFGALVVFSDPGIHTLTSSYSRVTWSSDKRVVEMSRGYLQQAQ
jgi:hypothetical protein